MELDWRRGRLFQCRRPTSGGGGRGKEAHLRQVLREAGCAPRDAVFFDDLVHNVNVARRLGVEATLVDRRAGFGMATRTLNLTLTLTPTPNPDP
mmetsp:Transcript_6696/g.19175  ORF Transcript_6696/g.19175 Transcript_6696/m.19175 type:complete len:94 (-) Transcript_6696:6-287(-)